MVVRGVDASQTHGVVWCDGRRSAELRTGMEIEVVQGGTGCGWPGSREAPFTDRLVNKFGLRVEGWRGAAEAMDPLARPGRAVASERGPA